MRIDFHCDFCSSKTYTLIREFSTPPHGEDTLGISPQDYRRALISCVECGHYYNQHAYGQQLKDGYQSDYRKKAYGEEMRRSFERIMSLPPGESNNLLRIKRLHQVLAEFGFAKHGRLLDIGSGTAIFGAAMKQQGWDVTAADVDPVSTAHARDVAGLKIATGYFLDIQLASLEDARPFELVTLNKVLEHVEAPIAIAMLRHTRDFLVPNGFVYIELPDGESAAQISPERAEFFLEHFGAFSMASMALLAKRAGLTSRWMERVQEPSGKLTLRALLSYP